MTMPLLKCRRRLATLWFGASGLLFLLLFLFTMTGGYGQDADATWSWFFPSVIPTLSLIIGVTVADGVGKADIRKLGAAQVDPFFYRLTFAISVVYLAALLLLLLYEPHAQNLAANEFAQSGESDLLSKSNFILGPLQGLIAASIGVFFTKHKEAA